MAVLPRVARLSACRSAFNSSLVRTRPLDNSRKRKFNVRKKIKNTRAVTCQGTNEEGNSPGDRLSPSLPVKVAVVIVPASFMLFCVSAGREAKITFSRSC
jgi:hypothetical protein